ncbi:MAG: ribosomal RNA small subunit methyltransferase A [Candidatus Omnitrophica bacterium]|nr:ribosomal RNA small subunit methyltransferase A [Candidatus Omnitrophota bacterium]
MRSKKHLSQFFLVNKKYLEKISDLVSVHDQEIMVEIGSGKGQLTDFLIGKQKSIICVEIDPAFCEILNEKYADIPFLDVVCADIRKFKLPDKKVIVVGNVPYHLSFEIINFVISNRDKVPRAYLTFQKEFARKLAGRLGTKDYGYLSCFMNIYADAKILFTIPKTCFHPRPKVDAAFLEIKLHSEPKAQVSSQEAFLNFLRNVFSQRRKKIANIIENLYPHLATETILATAQVLADLRPENISFLKLAQLYKLLSN